MTFLITLFTLNACGAFPNYIPNLRRGNGDGDALIEDYFGLGFSYSEVSHGLLCWKLSLVHAFPLRSACVPFARKRLLRRLGGWWWRWENNRNVAVVVSSFTIYEAVLKKKLSVGPMWDRCRVDV